LHKKASIIATGSELTEGIIIDRNANYIVQRLKEVGIETLKIIEVKDDLELIKNSVEDSLNISDIIILTGGLGPTKDDLTVRAVAEVLKRAIIFDEAVYKYIEEYYNKKVSKSLDILKKQAYIIEGAKVIPNLKGSAPGQKINTNGKVIYLMPGPFREASYMFDNFVLPELTNGLSNKRFEYTLYFYGLTEAEFMDSVSKYVENIDYSTKIEEYIGPSIRLRFDSEEQFVNVYNLIINAFPDNYIGLNSLEVTLFQELLKQNFKISFAESCTGGMISDIFVSIPGVSQVFVGSVVTYSNELKQKILKVKEHTLEKYGAVSTETVLEMAKGLYDLTGSDLCISVSGIAGPEGGTNEKPVGTVHFGMFFQGRLFSIKKVFDGNREDIRKRASYYALWSALKAIRNIAVKPIKEWGFLSNYLSY
jgi:nicotinamide-nucleotide amidase